MNCCTSSLGLVKDWEGFSGRRGSKMDLTFLNTLNIHTHTHPFIHALQGKDHLHTPGLRYLARDGGCSLFLRYFLIDLTVAV